MSAASLDDEAAPRSRFILAILTIALVVNYMQRNSLAMLVQPIKHEFDLSDTQVGFLTGLAFSAIYAACLLPVARYADKGHRRFVIVTSLVLSSILTAVAGVVQNFTQLLVARLSLGVAESGCVPASESIIADLYPPNQRNTAMAIYVAGATGGTIAAFAICGLLETAIGWRATLFAMALPGIGMAIVLRVTMGEPSKRFAPEVELSTLTGSWLKDLWSNFIFRHMPFIQAAWVILTVGQLQWLPAYLERSFGLSRAEIGTTLAMTQGIVTIFGMVVGGMVCDRFARRHHLWPVKIGIVSVTASALPLGLLYTTDAANTAFAASAIAGFLLALPGGTVSALVQSSVAPDRRATAAATTLTIGAVLGLGGGPLLVGALSDYFAPHYGDEALRAALLTTTAIIVPWLLFHLLRIHRLLGRHHRASASEAA